MKHSFLLTTLLVVSQTLSAADSLPPEVQRFIADRDVCDHFRGEEASGDTPEQRERRAFIIQSMEIFCSGTDKRLAALRRRYKNDSSVINKLGKYENRIET
jgi:hypothetical protein